MKAQPIYTLIWGEEEQTALIWRGSMARLGNRYIRWPFVEVIRARWINC